MTRLFVIACLAVSLIFPIAARAVESETVILNLQIIMRDSKAAQSIRDQVEAKREQFQKEFSKEEEKLREMEKEIVDQRSLLSPEAFEEERKKFAGKLSEVQKDTQTKRAQLERGYATALAEVQKHITKIVKDIAEKRGALITMPASQTLFYSDKLDITTEVLERLDSELPKVTVTLKSE